MAALLLGLIQLPLGIWALRRPGMTLAILITLVGVWAIAAGIIEAVLALELRAARDDVVARTG